MIAGLRSANFFSCMYNYIGGREMQNVITNNLASVMTKLDKMTLTDRFLFNETVEDQEIYN